VELPDLQPGTRRDPGPGSGYPSWAAGWGFPATRKFHRNRAVRGRPVGRGARAGPPLPNGSVAEGPGSCSPNMGQRPTACGPRRRRAAAAGVPGPAGGRRCGPAGGAQAGRGHKALLGGPARERPDYPAATWPGVPNRKGALAAAAGVLTLDHGCRLTISAQGGKQADERERRAERQALSAGRNGWCLCLVPRGGPLLRAWFSSGLLDRNGKRRAQSGTCPKGDGVPRPANGLERQGALIRTTGEQRTSPGAPARLAPEKPPRPGRAAVQALAEHAPLEPPQGRPVRADGQARANSTGPDPILPRGPWSWLSSPAPWLPVAAALDGPAAGHPRDSSHTLVHVAARGR